LVSQQPKKESCIMLWLWLVNIKICDLGWLLPLAWVCENNAKLMKVAHVVEENKSLTCFHLDVLFFLLKTINVTSSGFIKVTRNIIKLWNPYDSMQPNLWKH
jgi:hypothetical protein